jgi:glycosyltransferase involved in cell wall biosynthesis
VEKTLQFEKVEITVLIPVYNKSDRLKNCLNSLELQKNKKFKIIISDNLSTDTSNIIIEDFLNKTSIKSEYYRQGRNIGSWSNFEFLLSKLNTEYFFFLDAEDELSENYIEQIILRMVSGPEFIEVLVPQFMELGINQQQRMLLAPAMLNIPFEARLPFLLSVTNLAGVAYLWYAVYKTSSSKDLFEKLIQFAIHNPTRYQAEDIAFSWAVVTALRNITVDLSMTLSHYSKLKVDESRQYLNHKAIETIYAQTHPEILLEAINVFEGIFGGAKEILEAAKSIVYSNIELTNCREKMRLLLATQLMHYK